MNATKKVKPKDAVLLGIQRNLTAKETSFEYGIPVNTLYFYASTLKVSFRWSRIGPYPKNSGSPPLQTQLKREKHTNWIISKAIADVLPELDPSSKVARRLMEALSIARRRITPE